MRIGRSKSPPPLPFLPPKEKSWALEAEREASIHGENGIMQSENRLEQRHGCASSKRLHDGGELFCRRAMGNDVLTRKRVSKNYDSRLCKNDNHVVSGFDDSENAMRHTEWRRKRSRRFTSAFRCYPPSEQARNTNLLSRGTDSLDKSVHSSKTCQECSSLGKWTLAPEMHLDQSGRVEPLCTTEEQNCFGQNGSSEQSIRHFRNLTFRQSRAGCNYGSKISLNANWENEEIPNKYMRAVRKRRGDVLAFSDAIRKQDDNDAAYKDLETKQYDNASACHASDNSISMCNRIGGPQIVQSTRIIGNARVGNQGDEKEHHEMMVLSHLKESQILDPNYDSREPEFKKDDGGILDAPASMDIDDDTEILGVVSLAKICAGDTKVFRRRDSQKLSNKPASSVLWSPRGVLVDVTNRFELHAAPGMKEDAQETDAHKLSQRQRQVEYGKNTLGYERYIEVVSRLKRKPRDPHTPNPKQVCSKRSWDGQIRKWRRLLHVYDPPSEDGEELAEDLSVLKSQRACIQVDARGVPTLPQRYELEGETEIEDANLTIYDDWKEL